MSVTTLECDTCKRQIDIERNVTGLEAINRCVITHGCRGRLYQVDLHPDFVRGRPLLDIIGLDNWFQRKALHNHVQTIRRKEWKIKHDMGGNPAVQVFVDRPTAEDPDFREEVLPDNTIIVNNNEIILEFVESESGVAQLVARATDPLLNASTVTSAETAEEPTQISSNGTITIVSRLPAYIGANITMEFIYRNSTNNNETTITEIVDDQPSILSPWVDANQVVIKGNRYVVRSLNIRIPEVANGTILNGAGVRLNKVDGNNINPNEFFLLLGKSPFTIVDKDFTRVIDLAKVTSTTNTFSLFFDNAEWRAFITIIESVFPIVKIIS